MDFFRRLLIETQRNVYKSVKWNVCFCPQVEMWGRALFGQSVSYHWTDYQEQQLPLDTIKYLSPNIYTSEWKQI